MDVLEVGLMVAEVIRFRALLRSAQRHALFARRLAFTPRLACLGAALPVPAFHFLRHGISVVPGSTLGGNTAISGPKPPFHYTPQRSCESGREAIISSRFASLSWISARLAVRRRRKIPTVLSAATSRLSFQSTSTSGMAEPSTVVHGRAPTWAILDIWKTWT